MSVLYIVAAAIVLLGPLIAIHEFGHYWVARKLGVKVLVYSIGFGPALLKWTSKRSGIEYKLAAIPLGGYVRMLDEREAPVSAADQAYAFNRQPPWKRILIVAAGPFINLIFAVLLFWILLLPAQEQLNTRVGKVMNDSVAAASQLQVGDKITAVDGQAVSTWEQLNYALVDRAGETGQITLTLQRTSPQTQVAFEIPNASQTQTQQQVQPQNVQTINLPIQNFLKDTSKSPLEILGFLPYRPAMPAIVHDLTADGAAIRQGMQAGDRIVAIDGKPIKDWFEVVDIVQKSPEKLLQITVQRQQKQLNLAVMPQAKRDDMGNVTGMLGVQAQPTSMHIPAAYKQNISYNPAQALWLAVDKTSQISGMILHSMVKMVRGLIGLENLSGPITIAKVAGQTAELGWQSFIGFMALMSVSLGILNLLPIPMLDGGHLVYYFIEVIRGKPVSEHVQMWGLKLGMVLLGSMMFLALFNDLMRL